MENEIDLLQQELKNLLRQLQQETGETDSFEIEEIAGVNLKELEKAFDESNPRMLLQFTKIHPDAVTPSYAYPSDSGFDLHSCVDTVVPANGRVLVPTGLILKFDESSEIQIRPKSGLALNHGLTVLNTPGTVDYGYLGEIKVILFNTTDKDFVVEKGMKIAQAVLCPVFNGKVVDFEEVDSFEDTDRSSNGFGSTGLK